MKLTKEQLRTTDPYCTILNKLCKGRNCATPVIVLCASTGLSDRVLRKHIETMRASGVCIVSNEKGYYLPENEEDLERYIKRTEKTARSYFYSLRSAKKALREMQTETQMKLPE